MLVRLSAATAAAFALAASAPTVSAAPDGGKVSGTITLPKPEKRAEPPVRNRGFFDRMPNPVRPPRPLDPRSELVVVLDGGDPSPEDTKPPKRSVDYELIGESFTVPVLPVISGSKIQIVNKGERSPRLFCPDFPDLLDGDPISPNGERDFNDPVGDPYQMIEIRDRDSAHLRGHILPLPNAYFSTVNASGKFEIDGVPAGSWTVRLWYRGGWIKLPKTEKVEVRAKRTSNATIALPIELKIAAAGKEG